MSKSKIVGIMALIVFAMGMVLVGYAMAEERGNVAVREVFYAPTIHILKVPDVEGHTIHLWESKGIGFNEKWGAYLITSTYTMDLIKGEGPVQGYNQYTYPDGSTITNKFECKLMGGGRSVSGASSGEGTGTYIKGTGKFEGIQGGGTFKVYIPGPGQYYSDGEYEYTLP